MCKYRMYYPNITEQDIGKNLSLDNQQINYLCNVLRLTNNTEIELFADQANKVFLASLQIQGSNNSATIVVNNIVKRIVESPLRLSIAQVIGKAEKMEYTIQKAVELGANKIFPLYSERSIKKIADHVTEKKILHWQKIANEAARQSGRSCTAMVYHPLTLQNWLPQAPVNTFVLHPHGQSIKHIEKITEACLVIGPEGGFSSLELNTMQNLKKIQLGPRILRTETAALVALSILQSLWGDI